MIFTEPKPFEQALKLRRAKRVLPTRAGSRELSELAPEIRERATFSARTSNAGYLAKMDRLLTEMVSPAAGEDDEPVDPGAVRLQLREELEKIGYQPEKGKAGGLQDLGSDARLNLIIDTNVRQAYGYGQFLQQNDPDILDAFPCLELYRLFDRKEKRPWRDRWVRAGGKLYGGRRMIARKDDPIWTRISRFGTPYPPFDFNSGMSTEEVDRQTAEDLGVISRRDAITPQQREFNEEVEASFPDEISSALAQVLQDVFAVRAGKILLQPGGAS